MSNISHSVFSVGRMILCVLAGLLVQSLFAPSLAGQTGELPQGTTVKDNGPSTYRAPW